METSAKIIFYLSLTLIFYVYFGYPALVFIISQIKSKFVKKDIFEPTVTIVIAAYNEEAVIENTIKNKLALDYDRRKLEIIVVSDGSEDRTDEIVNKYVGQGVKLIRQEPRAGKTAALNRAISEASGEIIVFSDANSIYKSDALKLLMKNFADPEVGYVTGKMVYTNSRQSDIGDSCSAYMKYENMLRTLEARIGSIVGVDGGIDAVRKSLYTPMRPDQLPDFILPLKVVEMGFRVVYESGAILQEPSHENTSDEYSMRLRVTLRAMWALYDMRQLLNVRKFKVFSIQLWSHKVLRYACFVLLVSAYLSNLILWNAGSMMKAFFLLQTALYLIGAIITLNKAYEGTNRYLNFIKYFLILNLASAHAFIQFMLGHKKILWNPRK